MQLLLLQLTFFVCSWNGWNLIKVTFRVHSWYCLQTYYFQKAKQDNALLSADCVVCSSCLLNICCLKKHTQQGSNVFVYVCLSDKNLPQSSIGSRLLGREFGLELKILERHWIQEWVKSIVEVQTPNYNHYLKIWCKTSKGKNYSLH